MLGYQGLFSNLMNSFAFQQPAEAMTSKVSQIERVSNELFI